MRLSLIILFVVSTLFLKAQKQEIPMYREVIIVTKEQTLKFQIKVLKQTITAKSDLTYFWYSGDKVHTSQGSYDGYLLDGYYRVFGLSGQLIAQGSFEKGIKTGDWRMWYDSGVLKELSHYKEGKLHGEQKIYNDKGEMVENYIYSGDTKRDLFVEAEEAKKQKEAKAAANAEKEKLKEEQKKSKEAVETKESKKKFSFKSLFKKKEKKADDSAKPSKSK